jgi:hypothetical protein
VAYEETEAVSPPHWWSIEWWRWFGTIVLASVVAGLVFFLGNWRLAVNSRRAADRVRRAADREHRISRVVDAYVNIVNAPARRFAGVAALLVAGVKSLETHEEIKEALRQIAERTGQSVLGPPAESVGDLHAMFSEVSFDGTSHTGYEAALAKHRK